MNETQGDECPGLPPGTWSTRWEGPNLAVNFLTTVKLTILQRYLRILAPIDPSDRPWPLEQGLRAPAGPRQASPRVSSQVVEKIIPE
jgi:hypothetical protein